MSSAACQVEESDPVPVRLTVAVVGDSQPAVSVLLPDSPGAMATIVIAGDVPDPLYDRLTEIWSLVTMLNPVTDMLSTVLIARKLEVVLYRYPKCPAYGPGPGPWFA